MNQPQQNPDWLHWPQTQSLIAAFSSQPDSLRFVGGAVRDALLGRSVQDVDAATTLLPEAAMALLEKSAIRVIPTGVTHGTVTAVIKGKSFEITTLRRDVATDGRHAEVAYTDDWKVDASRRDFTMNALYLSPQGELFDYFRGADDAKAGKVRFIGDANQRIREDYLRALRFFRFYAHYGVGEPDAAALAACAAESNSVATLSGERVQHELMKLLRAPKAADSIHLMHAHQLLPYVLGFGVADCSVFSRFKDIETLEGLSIPDPVRLAGFILRALMPAEDASLKLASRLRLSNHLERSIHILLQWAPEINPHMTVAEQKRLIRKLGEEDFSGALVLNWAGGSEPVEMSHPYYDMLVLAADWQSPKFPVSGNDLIALGVKPGKEMGEVLHRLEEEWESGDYQLGKEQLLKTVKVT